MWPKIIDLIINWLKTKPRSDLMIQVMTLREAMHDCHETYLRFSNAKAQGDQAVIDQSYREWRGAFGMLDTAVAEVDDVLHIFGKEARRKVQMYLLSESKPCAEDGYAVSAAMVQLLREEPRDPQATTGNAEFADALHKLDEFISGNFEPEEIVAAKQSVYRRLGHSSRR